MASSRSSGSPTSFWNAAAVGAAGVSTVVEVARAAQQIVIFVQTSATTTITVQVAHSGAVDSYGSTVDASTANWSPLFYINTACTMTLTGASFQAMIIPDFCARWVRLVSSAAATITAGHEVTG